MLESLKSEENFATFILLNMTVRNFNFFFDRLVQLDLMHYCTYICCLYTRWSSADLSQICSAWISNLGSGFPLRCFQRLSLGCVATQRCSGRNNWYTRDTLSPVLSY
jgi:hypothetical protein